MARDPHSSDHDFVGRITDMIASHSKLSAAAAFQMGVLLGQVMNNTGALKGIQKTMAAAPGAIASHLPSFGLFDSKPAPRKAARKTTRKSAPKRKKTASRSKGGKRV
jgi:hypothetical protein